MMTEFVAGIAGLAIAALLCTLTRWFPYSRPPSTWVASTLAVLGVGVGQVAWAVMSGQTALIPWLASFAVLSAVAIGAAYSAEQHKELVTQAATNRHQADKLEQGLREQGDD